MFFQELVEQHRVHRFVTDAVGLASLITSHQIGIYFFHLFGNQAKLRDASGIQLMLVMERDRSKREDCFTRLVHRLDVVLVACRGCGRAEVPVGVYDNCYTCWNGRPADALDKCGGCCTPRGGWGPAYSKSRSEEEKP